MMKVNDLRDMLSLQVLTEGVSLDAEVLGGYVSDLLSDVMANAKEGDIWITLQTHLNIVAIASLKGITGIIIVNGRRPDEETLKKASEEGIPIMSTKESAFEVAGKLYKALNV
jgi:predicted transcriptional regulator